MNKICMCGKKMAIRINRIIYRHKVEIEGVPIWVCLGCDRYEVLPYVKEQLLELVEELGERPARQILGFGERNEIARLIAAYCEKGGNPRQLKLLVEERINELLDMLLLARSLEDTPWEEDIGRRLSVLTAYPIPELLFMHG
ncbi:hypothetical protein [Gorillibacterium massiliense]|uniref:hypothetical protein n=1 Tax=Gorillibacterium massiliense TaxID=1280390 RepID=UPI00059403C8|nr:hypothetical protein [Gorillibacterium massiliense]